MMLKDNCVLNNWALCLFIVMAMLTACSGNDKEEARKVIVNVARPTMSQERGNEMFSFISQPWRTSVLSFRVSGPIDRFEVYSGNKYRCGNIIAEIDPRDFHIEKEKAEAAYKQMEAEYRRVEALYEKNNIPASQYEKTKADYLSAKASYNEAINKLEDTRLLAPFDGYIGEVFIEKYQDVKASQPVVTLIDIDRLKIEIFVTLDVAQKAQKSGEIIVTFDAYPEHQYIAKVIEVSKSTMSNNLSYLITAMLPNDEELLLAGMSGKAQLPVVTNNVSSDVEIPLSALCHRPQEGDFVWILNPDSLTVSMRKVTFNELLPNGKVRISSGLECNELIATTGLRFLSDGMSVEINGKL